MRDTPEPFDAARLIERMQDHARRQSITLPEGTADALNLAYQASMHTEEGRPLRFAFALMREGGTLTSELVLRPPVRDFDGLRRLAPAAGRERLCLRFGRDRDNEWTVLAIAPRQELTEPFAESFWGTLVLAEAMDPGCVVLRVNHYEVRYERGRYVTFDPLTSLRAILPAFIPDALAAYALNLTPDVHQRGHALPTLVIDEEAYWGHYEAFAEEVRGTARDAATDGVYFIAEYTNRLHHGGTLLFMDNPQTLLGNASAASARHTFSPVEDQEKRWNNAMLEALEWESHRRLAEKGASVLGPRLYEQFRGAEGLKLWTQEVCRWRIKTALEEWQASAHRCADLTQIDGVAVFDALLNPHGTGVKLLNVNDESVRRLPEAFRDAALGRGLRHQSAACAVASIPGSLALVVSQDGHVTAFAHAKDGMMAHAPIM
jgi:hypothetical protein